MDPVRYRFEHNAEAARYRQVLTWLGNFSYTLAAASIGDVLLLNAAHQLADWVLGLTALATFIVGVGLAPNGEPLP